VTKARATAVYTVVVSGERVEHLACRGVHQSDVGVERRHEKGLAVLCGHERCDWGCDYINILIEDQGGRTLTSEIV
jgi:hypothetical protein